RPAGTPSASARCRCRPSLAARPRSARSRPPGPGSASRPRAALPPSWSAGAPRRDWSPKTSPGEEQEAQVASDRPRVELEGAGPPRGQGRVEDVERAEGLDAVDEVLLAEAVQ